MKNDCEIQQDVLNELKWDSRIEAAEVGVEVHHGVVTLNGTVSSYAKKIAAQEAAHRVAGVLDVANDLQVHLPGGPNRTDTEIAETVRQALVWDVFVPEERILSTVSGGWVTLNGTVDRHAQREDAERSVRRLRGVLGVINRIVVSDAQVSPGSVKQVIESALARHAEREAKRIAVDVEDGVVSLSGSIGSWAEERAALGAAAHDPGVRGVANKLHIDPGA